MSSLYQLPFSSFLFWNRKKPLTNISLLFTIFWNHRESMMITSCPLSLRTFSLDLYSRILSSSLGIFDLLKRSLIGGIFSR